MKGNTSDQTMTAMQRVLLLPELRAQIFAWIYEDQAGYWSGPALFEELREDGPDQSSDEEEEEKTHSFGYHGVLLRCALVNKQWCLETMPLLWQDWDHYMWSLCDAFQRIEPSRRQLYANYVRTARLDLLEFEKDIEVARRYLGDIVFSKLESLDLRVGGNANIIFDAGIEIPVFHAPRLVDLMIDPRFEYYPDTYGVFQDEWEKLFELIPTRFPNTESVRFIDRARVFPGALKRLSDRLPRLKRFDASLVKETTYRGMGVDDSD